MRATACVLSVCFLFAVGSPAAAQAQGERNGPKGNGEIACRIGPTVALVSDPAPAERPPDENEPVLRLFDDHREWSFDARGPWQDLPDSRGLRGMRYGWNQSTTGEYAQLSREVIIPAALDPPLTLSFFCSDDYLDDGWRPESSSNSVDAYPGHRFKQVLIDGQVIWEQDIADASTPGSEVDFVVDISDHVQPGTPFTLALRNYDRVGLDTRLPGDFHLRGVYEGERSEGDEILASTCWWGDVMVWHGTLPRAPHWPRPSRRQVTHTHQDRWPYPRAGAAASLPITLALEGADGPLDRSTPVVCGMPLPESLVRDHASLSLWLDETELSWQAETMTHWPDGSLRWVLINTILPPGTQPGSAVRVIQGPSRTPPAPPGAVAATGSDGTYKIVSGELSVRCGQSPGALIDRIEWDGQPVCGPLSPTVQWQSSGGERTLHAVWDRIELLRGGPVRGTIQFTGSLADEHGALGPIVCRFDVFADASAVRITYRLFNAGEQTAALSRVRLAGVLPGAQRVAAVMDGQSAMEEDVPWRVHQTTPRSFVTNAGQSGQTADGVVVAGGSTTWLGVAVRHFWQQSPAALEVGPDRLAVDLFAGSEQTPAYLCRAGEAKRYEVWLVCAPRDQSAHGDAATVLTQAARALRPLRLFNADYFGAAEGLGYAKPHGGKYAAITEHMTRAYPDASYESLGLLFGVRDFGDGHYTAATPTFRNNYYDVMRGLFAEYLMGGGAAWFDRGEEAARHYMDIDQFHDSVRTAKLVGANASVYTPHHNDDLSVWPAMLRPSGGMLTYWRLSGDEDARESALMLADFIVRSRAGVGAGSVRDNAGPLHSLMWAYDETHDRRYLEAGLVLARGVLDQCVIPRRGTYAETHGGHNYRGNVPWMVAQLVEPLYLLYRFSGELWVADMLVGLVESVVCENMQPDDPGLFSGYTHSPVLNRQRFDNTGYNVLIAPCVGLAHELSGDPHLLEVMRGAYRHTVDKGTINDVRNCYWMTPTLLYLLDRADQREK